MTTTKTPTMTTGEACPADPVTMPDATGLFGTALASCSLACPRCHALITTAQMKAMFTGATATKIEEATATFNSAFEKFSVNRCVRKATCSPRSSPRSAQPWKAPDPKPDPKPADEGTVISFDLAADLASKPSFYDLPYPSDLRLTAKGGRISRASRSRPRSRTSRACARWPWIRRASR